MTGLEARIRVLENENAELKAALSKYDDDVRTRAELERLENEVAELLRSGKPTESYGERSNKKENPIEFLQRVYGRYLRKGGEALFLFQLRKIDPKFGKSLDTHCWKEGISVENFIPTKRLKTERTFATIGRIDEVRRAMNAVDRRRQLAVQQENPLGMKETLSKFDTEIMTLEEEVAKILGEGLPPETYSNRVNRSEKPIEFLKRVYGRYLEKGKESIYLDEIRKLDRRFVNVLAVTCSKSGVELANLVPLRTDRTEREIERIVDILGSAGAVKASKAMHAVKMRKSRKAQ